MHTTYSNAAEKHISSMMKTKTNKQKKQAVAVLYLELGTIVHCVSEDTLTTHFLFQGNHHKTS